MRTLALFGAVVVLAFLSLLTARGIVAYAPDTAAQVARAAAEELRSKEGHSGQGIALVMVAVFAAGIVLRREQ